MRMRFTQCTLTVVCTYFLYDLLLFSNSCVLCVQHDACMLLFCTKTYDAYDMEKEYHTSFGQKRQSAA